MIVNGACNVPVRSAWGASEIVTTASLLGASTHSLSEVPAWTSKESLTASSADTFVHTHPDRLKPSL